MTIDGRRYGSDIGYGQSSGERRIPRRYDAGLVFWYSYRGIPGGRIILYGGATSGVGRQVSWWTLPWR